MQKAFRCGRCGREETIRPVCTDDGHLIIRGCFCYEGGHITLHREVAQHPIALEEFFDELRAEAQSHPDSRGRHE